MNRRPGGLAIVLHTHMPYVEGFGTWPFGEEWLWEAIACSYLPLLDVLDTAPGRVTLSVTPVLGDQLAAPGALDRCLAFLREIRPASHRLDLPAATPAEAAALEHSAAVYAWAADALAAGGLAARMARHAPWTSSATHAVLPLLATDAGVRLQLATGIAAHRARSGGWEGGFWLPECAHAPWLDPLLEEAGVRLTCVDLTDVAPGAHGPLRPPAGPLLVPLDRPALELVWSRGGYPSHGAYRDTHRLTEHRHQAWAVDGAAYDPARAAARARDDAADFVARVRALGRFCCVAWDTELLGLHWHEGALFLAAVLEAAEAAGLRIAPLDELVTEAVAEPAAIDRATSWGAQRTLDTWSAPRAGGLAWRQRRAELRTVPGGGPRALRELLALQSSDWAFLVAHGTAGPYPMERAAGHEAALRTALAEPSALPAELRGLAPFLALG
jgi:1,4-alpha-glucan branching enzyme